MWTAVPFFLSLAVAWHHLSRGRAARGLVLLVLAFGLADAFLVRGWVLGIRDEWTRILEIALWAAGAGEFLLLARRKLFLGTERGRKARRGLFLQGGRCYALGDSAGAVRHFRRAARLDPWSPSVQVWLGFSLLLHGKRLGARRAFKRALARDPSGCWAYTVQRGMPRTRRPRRGGGAPKGGLPGEEGKKGGRKRKVPA